MTTKPQPDAVAPTAARLQPGDLLSEAEAAAILGAAQATLANWRWKGEGPGWVRLGKRAIRYRVADLQAFIEAGTA